MVRWPGPADGGWGHILLKADSDLGAVPGGRRPGSGPAGDSARCTCCNSGIGQDHTTLGPLTLARGRWGVGDTSRPDSHWVEFRPDGLCQPPPEAGRHLIPWSIIMNGAWITWGKHHWNTNSKGLYTLRGTVITRHGGWLHTTLRQPYEDHPMRFDQHTRPYRAVDVLRLESLLRQLTTGPARQRDGSWWSGRHGNVHVRGRRARQRFRRATPSGDPPFRRPGGVLVGPADSRVDVHVPGDQALRIGLGLKLGDDPRPIAVPLPAPEQVIAPVHGP